jgi:hypothetical protein
MKKSIIVSIFAFVFGVSSSQASAREISPSNQEVLLSHGESAALNNFMLKKAKRFVKANNEDLKFFNQVVTFYNSSTSSLMNVSKEDRQRFLAASDRIVNQLNKINSSDVNEWKKSTIVTTNVIRFVWNNQVEAIAFDMTELPVAPAVSK